MDLMVSQNYDSLSFGFGYFFEGLASARGFEPISIIILDSSQGFVIAVCYIIWSI